MADHDSESGIELVLDNRKLIIVFAVLLAFCGCFFVVGFVEGKRQGFQEGAQTAAESVPKTSPDVLPAPSSKSTGTEPSAKPQATGEQQLDWYKNVNRREGESEVASRTTTPSPARQTPASAPAKEPAKEPASKPKPPANAAARTGPVTYSVQVGAFRVRREAENKSKILQSKGFDCRIETSDSTDEYYYLKVGRYSTRAEAVAVQLRLKKSGFGSFIKSN